MKTTVIASVLVALSTMMPVEAMLKDIFSLTTIRTDGCKAKTDLTIISRTGICQESDCTDMHSIACYEDYNKALEQAKASFNDPELFVTEIFVGEGCKNASISAIWALNREISYNGEKRIATKEGDMIKWTEEKEGEKDTKEFPLDQMGKCQNAELLSVRQDLIVTGRTSSSPVQAPAVVAAGALAVLLQTLN